MSPGFVHLRVHSEYSLVDSVLRVGALLDAAQTMAMPAIALTDLGNLSAMVKFCRGALERGIKPILGADLKIAAGDDERETTRLTLLVMNAAGFRNLSRLLTACHAAAGAHGGAALPRESLDREALEGLIALSGAARGEIGRALLGSRPERAADALAFWQTLMPGRFYIELERLGRPEEGAYLPGAVELAAAAGVPVVATNEVCFLTPDDFEAHETRVCISHGRTLADPGRPRHYTEQQYLKSADEVQGLFKDLPEALANSVEIATRCSFEVGLGQVFLPDFALPDGVSETEQLRADSERGLAERLRTTGAAADEASARVYQERLERELGVISTMGFEGYFLIVADFIRWSRENEIPVGPGRGSGAGSLIAWVLGITDLDPIAHDLLFERFLNPERVSLPDFDVDFCIEGRDRVIDYVSRKYSRERVSQIVTFGTMAARAVVRDVGRVLGMPYGQVDRIAKMIPFELGITLEKALEEGELSAAYETDDDVRALIDLARPLEGLARNIGTHAGGVVIAPADLTEFMPLYVEPDGGSLSQLDKDDLEAVGLVKFDFLGLKTLTVIDKAVRAINAERHRRGEDPIDIGKLPDDDPATYALLNRCQTTAMFQLESSGMRDLIKRIEPDRFSDLVAIVALFRPGPMQMADDFIRRKRGEEKIDYLHPDVEPILRGTYGVILYQEQVMQIAQVLAGYSLGSADLLRRAMGKKKPEEMARQRSVFVEGAVARGVEPARAAYIFDLMEKFAGYGFNKSHSAAYALVAYQTAWLKAHYPEAYMAAVLTADMDNTDKLVVFKDDCVKNLGITVEPPNVNRSGFAFTVGGERRIVYGLGAIKGVGRGVVEAIIAERERNGPYTSLLEFCRRLDSHKLSRRVLEALVKAGALDGLGENRATLMAGIADTLAMAERSAHAMAAGQATLFGGEQVEQDIAQVLTPVREWSKRERLDAERESLGLCLTGHFFDEVAEHCRHFTHGPLAKLLGSLPSTGTYQTRREVTVAGVVWGVRRRGGRVSIELDDNTDRIEVSLFDEVYAQCRHLITKHAVLVIHGQLRYDDFLSAWRVTAQRVRSVDEAIEEYARRLTIRLSGSEANGELVHTLKDTLKPFTHGDCLVCVQYEGQGAGALLTLSDAWRVRPTRELRENLTRLLGEDHYSIHYPGHLL